MYLIFDTETTGFPLFQEPPDHSAQAHIVQLACVLLDKSFNERACFNSLILPERFQLISEGAYNAHGISVEDCEEFGMPIEDALNVFNSLLAQSDIRVAHNLKFDAFLMDVECSVPPVVFKHSWRPENTYCTMLKSTPLCGLTKGNGSPKWPKLQELHKHLFGHEFTDAHDALADVRATAKCFKELKEMGVV